MQEIELLDNTTKFNVKSCILRENFSSGGEMMPKTSSDQAVLCSPLDLIFYSRTFNFFMKFLNSCEN